MKRPDKPIRIARGTKQAFAVTEVVHAESGEEDLDEAIRRGIAMLCAEQLEHAFYLRELSTKD